MKQQRTIDDLFREGKPIDEAAVEGVRNALRRHKRLGESIVACVNGKGVVIPPDQINVSETEPGGTASVGSTKAT